MAATALVLALILATSSLIILCIPDICVSSTLILSELTSPPCPPDEDVPASFGGFSKMHSMPICLHLRQGGFSGPSQRAFCLRHALQARWTRDMVLYTLTSSFAGVLRESESASAFALEVAGVSESELTSDVDACLARLGLVLGAMLGEMAESPM